MTQPRWPGFGREQYGRVNHDENYLGVTNTAQRLVASRAGRVELRIKNNSAAIIYLGHDSGVTSAAGATQGYPLAAGVELIDVRSTDEWWVIAGAAGPFDCNALEFFP